MEILMTLYSLLLFYFIVYLFKKIYQKRDQCCYMLHYECYKPHESTKLSTKTCATIVERNKLLGLEEYRFLLKTIVSSGIGEETYAPINFLEGREASPTLADAFSETDDIMFSTLDDLFHKTGVSPSEIDILVVNVSLFSPSPSLTARIVNRYKMRQNIKSYNLSGLGCSASVIAIDLVQRMFKSYKNMLAVVVSTETISPHWYCGKDKSMMLSNCLFRTGGSSMLLTNKRSLKHQAIMKLNCVVRTHIGADDEAYRCCIQEEDDQGYQGFLLTRNLTKAAGRALTKNLRVLLPKVLPMKELIRYAVRLHVSKITTVEREETRPVLNVKSGIDHFCIHPGGRAVIEGVGKSLKLTEYDIEPARMALHRFGNTSSGGLWYVLGYMEAKKRLKKGDNILMISLGAGFESNNCVWEVMRDLDKPNVWKDSIDSYPEISKIPNPFMDKYSWINDESPSLKRGLVSA